MPRIVLRKETPKPSGWGGDPVYIAYFVFFNPLKNDIFNKEIVFATDNCVDGHYIIWASGGTRGGRNSVGIVHDLKEIELKAYEIAKGLAQKRAPHESYGWYNEHHGVPFVDETQRAKESKLVVAITD
jgi:hypothetical protein